MTVATVIAGQVKHIRTTVEQPTQHSTLCRHGDGAGPRMGRGFSATAWRRPGASNNLGNVRLRWRLVTVYGAHRCNVTMTDFIVMVLQCTRTQN